MAHFHASTEKGRRYMRKQLWWAIPIAVIICTLAIGIPVWRYNRNTSGKNISKGDNNTTTEYGAAPTATPAPTSAYGVVGPDGVISPAPAPVQWAGPPAELLKYYPSNEEILHDPHFENIKLKKEEFDVGPDPKVTHEVNANKPPFEWMRGKYYISYETDPPAADKSHALLKVVINHDNKRTEYYPIQSDSRPDSDVLPSGRRFTREVDSYTFSTAHEGEVHHVVIGWVRIPQEKWNKVDKWMPIKENFDRH